MLNFQKMLKLLIICLVTFGCLFILAVLGGAIFEKTYPYPSSVKFGVTFSPTYASYLKLDWEKTYLQMLDGLQVKNLRIPTYWNSLESEEGKYDFSQTDFMLEEASKRGVKVILVVGIRQPRWPECHIPAWAKELTVKKRQEKVLQYIGTVVTRYKSNSSIWAYQVENEFFLSVFGEGCDSPDENLLKSEIKLVQSLDNKTIILSDAGELGSWEIPMKLSDIFGTSIYRRVYNSVLGYQNYPIFPYMYNLKAILIKNFLGKPNQKTIVTELQAEPWLSDKDSDAFPQKQQQIFPQENFKNNVEYARQTGFDEVYLWGVEWWYFMAKNGYPEYLEYAKTLFK